MKKQLTILSALVMVALSSFYFTGCTTEETVATGNVATNLRAVSLDGNKIGLRWTRDANDQGTNTVIVRNSSGIFQDSIIVSGPTGSSTTYTGVANTEYSFSVRNDAGTSSSLNWMVANRFGPTTVYEFNATGASGLNLATGNAVSLSNNPTGAGVDFWLDEDATSPSGLMLKGGQRYDSTWRHSYVYADNVYATNAAGSALDEAYSSTDFSAFMNAVTAGTASTLYGNQFAIPAAANGSRIVTVETADGHLARIELIPNGTSYIYGTGSDRYIKANISYNPTMAKPYASRPHVRRGYEAPKTIF